MKKNHYFVLLKAIVITALVLFVAGAICKVTVCRKAGAFQNDPAITILFSMIREPEALKVPDPVISTPEPPPADPGDQNGGKDDPDNPAAPTDDPNSGQNNPGGDEPPAENNTPLTPHPVDRSYFDDALFVGDSRTLGMSQYGGLDNATFFADVGLTVFNAFDVSLNAGNYGSVTLSQLLSSGNFTKVYLMLGINELGYPFESLTNQYLSVVNKIRELEPDAKIILMANLSLTYNASVRTSYLSLDNIKKLNNTIASYANGTDILYLDVNPIFTDENGYLREDVSGDGAHPYASEYVNWVDWLCQNGF